LSIKVHFLGETLLLKLVGRISVQPEQVNVSLRPGALMALAALAVPRSPLVVDVDLVVPCRMFRRAREVRLAIAPGNADDAPARDPALIKLVTKAWFARKALMEGDGVSLQELAAVEGCEPGYFTVLLKLGFLDPAIVAAVLNSTQPERLTRQQLARFRNLPMDWKGQRRSMEFGSWPGSAPPYSTRQAGLLELGEGR
jgi:hypothetical protein